MVWAMGLDDFKGNCGGGRYPLLQEITNVLKDEDDCEPATTPEEPDTTADPQPTTENPPPQPTTNPPPETTAAPNPTTAAPNPTTTIDDSDSEGCRPTPIFANHPGMKDWCISNCAIGYCPASHCVGCDNPNLGSPGECRPTELYSNTPGMKQWCIDNCALGFCPASHCVDC